MLKLQAISYCEAYMDRYHPQLKEAGEGFAALKLFNKALLSKETMRHVQTAETQKPFKFTPVDLRELDEKDFSFGDNSNFFDSSDSDSESPESIHTI